MLDRLSGPKAKELLSHAQHDLFSVVRKHFVDERIRTLFTSYMHVITTENVAGAGIVFPAIFANIASFTLPVGGAVALPRADARGRSRRRRGHHRRRRQGDQGRERPRHRRHAWPDGTLVEGKKFVASAIDSPTTVRMAGEELFPEPVREKAKNWHWGNHSLVTLHLALKNPPAYRAASFDPAMAKAYNIFFGMDDIDQVASCFDDCAAKKFPKVLMGNGACNSEFDPSYAPQGWHTAFWWPFAPYSVDGGPQSGTRTAPTIPSAFSITGASMPPTSTATICSAASCSRRSTSSSSTSTCGRARCAWAPMCRTSSASTGRIR